MGQFQRKRGEQIMEKTNVFISQENKDLDYSLAEQYGNINFVTYTEFSPHKESLANKRLYEDIDTAMNKFSPEKDFIISSGNPISFSLLFYRAFRKAILKGADKLNVLVWNKYKKNYVITPIQITENTFFKEK